MASMRSVDTNCGPSKRESSSDHVLTVIGEKVNTTLIRKGLSINHKMEEQLSGPLTQIGPVAREPQA
jgi:hypothetical protein